jgi:hypothetical protein
MTRFLGVSKMTDTTAKTTATADPYGMTNKGTNNNSKRKNNSKRQQQTANDNSKQQTTTATVEAEATAEADALDGGYWSRFAGLQEAEQVLVVDVFLAVG